MTAFAGEGRINLAEEFRRSHFSGGPVEMLTALSACRHSGAKFFVVRATEERWKALSYPLSGKASLWRDACNQQPGRGAQKIRRLENIPSKTPSGRQRLERMESL